MSHRGAPLDKFLQEDDKVHLNEAGVAQFAANLKSSICASLGIPLSFQWKSETKNHSNGNHKQRKRIEISATVSREKTSVEKRLTHSHLSLKFCIFFYHER